MVNGNRNDVAVWDIYVMGGKFSTSGVSSMGEGANFFRWSFTRRVKEFLGVQPLSLSPGSLINPHRDLRVVLGCESRASVVFVRSPVALFCRRARGTVPHPHREWEKRFTAWGSRYLWWRDEVLYGATDQPFCMVWCQVPRSHRLTRTQQQRSSSIE